MSAVSEAAATEHLVTPRPQLRTARSRSFALTVRALGPVALLVLWWVASATGLLTPDVLASPAEVLRAVGELWGTGSCPTRSPPP